MKLYTYKLKELSSNEVFLACKSNLGFVCSYNINNNQILPRDIFGFKKWFYIENYKDYIIQQPSYISSNEYLRDSFMFKIPAL
jgi:hypothetical protein